MCFLLLPKFCHIPKITIFCSNWESIFPEIMSYVTAPVLNRGQACFGFWVAATCHAFFTFPLPFAGHWGPSSKDRFLFCAAELLLKTSFLKPPGFPIKPNFPPFSRISCHTTSFADLAKMVISKWQWFIGSRLRESQCSYPDEFCSLWSLGILGFSAAFVGGMQSMTKALSCSTYEWKPGIGYMIWLCKSAVTRK